MTVGAIDGVKRAVQNYQSDRVDTAPRISKYHVVEISPAAYMEITQKLRLDGYQSECLAAGGSLGYKSQVVILHGYQDKTFDFGGVVLAKAGDHY